MLVGVAIAALGCAVLFVWLPLMLRRSRIDLILREQYAAYNPFSGFLSTPTPTFERLKRVSLRDYDLLRSDPDAVARRLLRSATVAGPTEPNASKRPDEVAIWHLSEWLVEADSVKLAERYRDRLFDLATGGTIADETESAAIWVVSQMTLKLGLDDGRRGQARDRLRTLAAKPGDSLIPASLYSWMSFVGTIGGPEEIDLLFELLMDERPGWTDLVHQQSMLRQTRWPGMVARLTPLFSDPRQAEWALGFPVMLSCRKGRQTLLGFAEDASRPEPLRRKCVHLLKRDVEGLSLLLNACDDPAGRAKIAALFGQDSKSLVGSSGGDVLDLDNWPTYDYARNAADPSDPRPELRKLRDDYANGCRPWSDFGQVVWDEAFPSPVETEAAIADRRERVDRTLRRIEILAPGLPPMSAQGRLDWLFSKDRPSIPWAAWLAAIEQTPEDDERLTIPDFYQTLPDDAVAILVRLAHAHPSAFRGGPAQELLLKAERSEEVELVIDRMAEIKASSPDKLSVRDPELVSTLRRRFAVNFGWDIDAWRAWWKQERDRH